MNYIDFFLFFGAGALGAAVNSVAGGGTFLTFPLLIMSGMSPMSANITSTVALWPGSVSSALAYRRELTVETALMRGLLAASVVGALCGSMVLLTMPEAAFNTLVPYLLLIATLLFAFGNTGFPKLRLLTSGESRLKRRTAYGIQCLIGFYGGYFGAGIGILMLAMLQFMGMEQIHSMNALKTRLGSAINGVAVLIFILYSAVNWPVAITMLIGAVFGGFAGARLALQINPMWIRAFIVLVGAMLTVYFFVT